MPTEASGSSAGRTVDGRRDENAALVSFVSQGTEQAASSAYAHAVAYYTRVAAHAHARICALCTTNM